MDQLGAKADREDVLQADECDLVPHLTLSANLYPSEGVLQP